MEIEMYVLLSLFSLALALAGHAVLGFTGSITRKPTIETPHMAAGMWLKNSTPEGGFTEVVRQIPFDVLFVQDTIMLPEEIALDQAWSSAAGNYKILKRLNTQPERPEASI